MGWQPRWRHCSQLYAHPGDVPGAIEGANDCFEACLARYLRETGYPFAGDDHALVGAMRLLATGQTDQAGQGFTSLEQAGRVLGTLGIAWRWTAALAEAQAANWAICWVYPARLRTAAPNQIDGRRVYTDYPLWWLGARDEPDHFVLWLPDGAFNDPLSYWNGNKDTIYTPTSLAAAFAGAFVLDSKPHAAGTDAAHAQGQRASAAVPRAPADTRHEAAVRVTSSEGLHVRQAPTASAPIVATLQEGATVRDAYDDACLWTFVHVEALDTYGWVRREYTRAVR